MAMSSFETLPVEILDQVCACLSLKCQWALASTSTTCYVVAQAHLFYTIHLNIGSSKTSLQSGIDQWKCLLDRTAAYEKVRSLVIQNSKSNPPLDTKYSPFGVGRVRILADAAGDLASWFENPPADPSWSPARNSITTDFDWLPLAEFVRNIPHLHTLLYKSSEKMSDCLAAVLRQSHPKCSIHALRFEVCDLNVTSRATRYLNPIIMPQLRGLCLRMSVSEGEYGLRQTCLRRLLKRTPNVHELALRWSDPDRRRAGRYLALPQIRHTEYLSNDTDDMVPSKSVRKLRLRFFTVLQPVYLAFLNHHIDLTALVVLRIDAEMSSDALVWIAENCNFASLETLAIVSIESVHQPSRYTEAHFVSWTTFLQSLPSLRQLRIRAALRRDVVTTIFQCHGQSLHRLWLETTTSQRSFVFDHDLVVEMQQACPYLEDIRVPVPRLQGTLAEVGIYRAFGTIKKLRHLHLTVCINNSFPHGGVVVPHGVDFDAFDSESLIAPQFTRPHLPCEPPLLGCLRRAFVDSAVDEKLARAIFDIISSIKTETAGTMPLESLVVMPKHGQYFKASAQLKGYCDIIENLSRWWLLVRDIRDDHRQKIHAEELGRSSRLSDNGSREYLGGPDTIHEFLVKTFCQLWQNSCTEQFWWRDSWYSFPLATVA